MFRQRSRFLLPQPEFLHRLQGEPGDVELDHLVARQAAVVQRIGGVARLGEVAFVEGAFVHDDHAAGRRSRMLTLSAAGFMATSTSSSSPAVVTSFGAEVDLKRGDAEGGAGRRPDFGREIGEGGEVVARQRGFEGELGPGDLHAIAGIPGEPDDHIIARLALGPGSLGRCGRSRNGRHGTITPRETTLSI